MSVGVDGVTGFELLIGAVAVAGRRLCLGVGLRHRQPAHPGAGSADRPAAGRGGGFGAAPGRDRHALLDAARARGSRSAACDSARRARPAAWPAPRPAPVRPLGRPALWSWAAAGGRRRRRARRLAAPPPVRRAVGLGGGGRRRGCSGGWSAIRARLRAAAMLGFDLSKSAFVATATAIALVVDAARMPIYALTDGPGPARRRAAHRRWPRPAWSSARWRATGSWRPCPNACSGWWWRCCCSRSASWSSRRRDGRDRGRRTTGAQRVSTEPWTLPPAPSPYFVFAPVSRATPDSVVCAAFRPSRKSSSEKVA